MKRRVTTRRVRPTALIFCEGAHDTAFVRYLISLYAAESKSHAAIRVRQGRGGAVDGLVQSAIKSPGAYDRRLVKLDSDRASAEINAAKVLAKREGVVLVFSIPCLDATLLAIIDDRKDYTLKRSGWCKKEFESRYISAEKRTVTAAYARLFSRPVIEAARLRVAALDELVNFIQA